jgi:hypothetical protein
LSNALSNSTQKLVGLSNPVTFRTPVTRNTHGPLGVPNLPSRYLGHECFNCKNRDTAICFLRRKYYDDGIRFLRSEYVGSEKTQPPMQSKVIA